MLLRFTVANLYSFHQEKEFNMLPGRINRLSQHKYEKLGMEALKLAAIYGANGAGKSNLIKSIAALREIVVVGDIPREITTEKFKLCAESAGKPISLAIEFITGGKIYYYSIKVDQGVFSEEELFLVDPKDKDASLLFSRRTKDEKTKIDFDAKFEESAENRLLQNLIEKTLIKPEKSLLNLLATLDNENLNDIKTAYTWFDDSLEVILPTSKPTVLAQRLDVWPKFRDFANELICSFATGVTKLHVEKTPIEEYLGEENRSRIDEISSKIKADSHNIAVSRDNSGEVIFANENGKVVAKRILLEHKSDDNSKVRFTLGEESDGTNRLLEYIPALQDVIFHDKVIVVDEMERSIHSLVVKEIVSKFAADPSTKGQLIFSTHDANLLDQEFLRQDEIWFAQKNNAGATEIYPLSDFKEHHTLDIRKGYMNGRYGAIPFLGNLRDLNWDQYADPEPTTI